MAITPTSLPETITPGQPGHIAHSATAYAAINALTGVDGDGLYHADRFGVSVGGSATANTSAMSALQTAAAAAGKEVVLPPGTVALNAFTVLTPTRGAGINQTVLEVSGTVTIGASSVALSSLTVKSSSQTAISAANKTDVSLSGVRVDYASSVTTNWLALDAYNITRLHVSGSRFRIGGLQVSICEDFLIQGNHFDCEYVNTNEPCHITGASSGQFVNNTVYRTLTDGLDLYSSGRRCIVAGNRFHGLRGAAGIECKVTMSDNPSNTSGPDNKFEATVIANNVLYDFNPPAGNATRVGIYAEYVDTRAAPAFAVTETNCAIIISGNVLEDFNVTDPGAGSIVSYWGIGYTGHNGLITNNVIRNMPAWQGAVPLGIRLSQPADSKCVGVRVASNVIAGVQGSTGILVGSLDRCQIDDNIVRQDEVTGLAPKFGVGVAAGRTLTECSISGNIFECNVANSYGIRGESTTAVLTSCRVHNNTLRDCGLQFYAVQKTSFLGNVIENATNSQGFNLGISGTSSRGNTFTGNHICMSADYGLVLTDCDGLTINGNSFRDTARGVLLQGASRKGVVVGNLSINQSSGTEFPHYSGVSAPDQATNVIANNLVTT